MPDVHGGGIEGIHLNIKVYTFLGCHFMVPFLCYRIYSGAVQKEEAPISLAQAAVFPFARPTILKEEGGEGYGSLGNLSLDKQQLCFPI